MKCTLLIGMAGFLALTSPLLAGEVKVYIKNGTTVVGVANTATTCKKVGANNICGLATVKALGKKVSSGGLATFNVPKGYQVCFYSNLGRKCLGTDSGTIKY